MNCKNLNKFKKTKVQPLKHSVTMAKNLHSQNGVNHHMTCEQLFFVVIFFIILCLVAG